VHLVALLRTDLTEDDKAMRLLRLVVGLTSYEARQHASIAPPRVLASRANADEAQALAASLVNEGLHAIAFTPDDVFSDAKRFHAKHIELTDDGVNAHNKQGAHASLPWADVSVILVGTKNKLAFTDLVDTNGNVLTTREGETVFEGTGSRAGCIALGQTARGKSNGRFDDRLMKPAAIATIMGAFASMPNALDVSGWLLFQSFKV
jgi:hypothetical protein